MFSRLMDLFSKENTVEFRTKALLCFLPKWRGFFVNEETAEMSATEALVELIHVVECLTRVWVGENWQIQQRKPANFEVQKVTF